MILAYAFLLVNFVASIEANACNASELFDVLLRDFWLLQFGHTYLGGQLPDTEESYALAVASCKIYSTQFEKHRFLLQACFQAGEYKSTSLQHRMAGLCNPKVLESLRPNLSCLRKIYASKSYDVCMAAALQQQADHILSNAITLRYSDQPYNCINVRQSVLCSQQAANVHCDDQQLNNIQNLFDTVWANNAIVEGHYECPLRPIKPFEKLKIHGEAILDRRRLDGFCKINAKAVSDSIATVISTHPNQLVRELLIQDTSQIFNHFTARLASYMQCARVALFGTKSAFRGFSFSPMHDWISVLESFLSISQDLRRLVGSNTTCGSELITRRVTTPCFQCTDKLAPAYSLSDYRYNPFTFSTYADAIVEENDALSFCRATISLVKFIFCLTESVYATCGYQIPQVISRIETLRNETEVVYGCASGNSWYADLESLIAYNPKKVPQRTVIASNISSFC